MKPFEVLTESVRLGMEDFHLGHELFHVGP